MNQTDSSETTDHAENNFRTGTALVTGAGGGIGRVLVEQLAHNMTVRGLFRSDDERAATARENGVEVVIGDLRDSEVITRAVAGTNVIYHTAAAVARDLKHAREINVDGTRTLAEAAAGAGVERFVFLSSVAVYVGAATEFDQFPETVPPRLSPRMDRYSRTKWEAELALQEIADHTGLGTVVLRPTCVYGPGVESWTLVTLEMIAKGMPLQMTRGEGHIDLIHVRDLVAATIAAGTDPAAVGEVFNVGGESMPTERFLGVFGRLVGRSPKKLSTGGSSAIAAIGSAINRVVPLPPDLEPNRLRVLKLCTTAEAGEDRFPSAKIQQTLGWQPVISLDDGIFKTTLSLGTENRIGESARELIAEAETYRFRPRAILEPTAEHHISEAIRAAVANDLPLRTIGSLHSIVPAPATEGLCLRLDRMPQTLTLEGDRVRVGAGVSIAELNRFVAESGRSLPSLGGISDQTVSGATATGTHGSTIHHGSFTDSVVELKIITPADPEPRTIGRDHPDFAGLALSVGCCGIITELVFQTEPLFHLRSRVEVLETDHWLSEFDSLTESAEYTEFFWHPLVDRVEVVRADRIDPVPDRVLSSAPMWSPGWIPPRLAERVMRLMDHGKRRWLQRRIVNGRVGENYPQREGRSHFVLAYQRWTPIGFPLEDIELGVPRSEAVAAIEALRNYFRRVDRYPTIGVRLRFQKAEPFLLSASNGRDLCWIETYHTRPAEDFLGELHELLNPFDYRPHWGKSHPERFDELSARTPAWNEFRNLRQRCDPDGVLLNDYTRTRFADRSM